ncbi:MAG: hypothetical protein ACRDWV_01785 [Acidimicrobiales bacterium]
MEADSTGATSDTTSGWSTGASGLTITSAPGVAAILDGQGVSQYVLKYTGPGTGTNGLAVRDLTIEGSATNFGNGGGILNGNGSLSVAGSVLAGNGPDCGGANSVTDDGYNIDSDGSCGFSAANHSVSDSTSLVGSLGMLGPNGGPTETILPDGGSSPYPAVGLVPNPTSVSLGGTTVALCPRVDQRGVSSTPGDACSAGADEAIAGVAPAFNPPTSASFPAGATTTFDVSTTGGVPAPTLSVTSVLPPWLAFTPGTDGTGSVSADPTNSEVGDTAMVTVVADNGVGTSPPSQVYTFSVTAPPPAYLGHWPRSAGRTTVAPPCRSATQPPSPRRCQQWRTRPPWAKATPSRLTSSTAWPARPPS